MLAWDAGLENCDGYATPSVELSLDDITYTDIEDQEWITAGFSVSVDVEERKYQITIASSSSI